ncbi:MAG: DUF177 domain-containing protein [Candidatus Borkfalkiaceae bacterium]|nr:DUF177 domain-containing protein [Christensenellaceae bacterium]
MVIDVKKLKRSGKESCSFHFDYEADDSAITLPDAEYSRPVSVNGTLTLGGNEVWAEGEIEYFVSTKCSRCLDDVIFHNIVEYDETFSEDDNADGAYLYSRGLVDLTEMVNEKLLLSFPVSVLCKEDCKGICSGCGVNLNHEDCKCK